MRCKKHPSDLSSSVGVCASCLRERLFALIAAQAQAQAQTQAQAQAQAQAQISRGHHSRSTAAGSGGGGGPADARKSDPTPPPLVFPRSVSPYVSRRKSEDATWNNLGAPENQHLRFYSTPQVGPTFAATSTAGSRKKKPSRFSFWSNLFRSRSEKFESDHRVYNRDSYAASSSSSPSWFTAIFTGRSRDKQSRQFYPDDTIGSRKPRRRMDRGMSPVRDAEYDYNYDDGDRSPSGSGYSTESTPTWKRTPTVAPPSARRSRQGNSRNVAGMAFCLSPLVRASPNRHWNQKTLPPEMGMVMAGGDARVSVKPHLGTAAGYCANRSRKLADFGRANHNR